MVGGAASVAGGGKFANGAVTGAFGYFFNAMCGGGKCAAFGGAIGTVVGSGLGAAAGGGATIASGGLAAPAIPEAMWGGGILGGLTGTTIGGWLDTVFNNENNKPETKQYPGNDPTIAPEGTEWRGRPGSTPEDGRGSYHNPTTGESYRPDLNHPEPWGPHWDYTSPDGKKYRIFPDGRMVHKKPR